MRYFVPLVTFVTLVSAGLLRADDTAANAPAEFAYTEIYTALSDDGTPVHSEVKRVVVSGPHQRSDRFNGNSEIIDALTSRMVLIDSEHKTYTVHERQRDSNTTDGSQTEFEIPKRQAHDYYKQLTWMPDDSKRVDLPEETMINDHRVRGVRVTHTTRTVPTKQHTGLRQTRAASSKSDQR